VSVKSEAVAKPDSPVVAAMARASNLRIFYAPGWILPFLLLN
jgi:hypothetical protein